VAKYQRVDRPAQSRVPYQDSSTFLYMLFVRRIIHGLLMPTLLYTMHVVISNDDEKSINISLMNYYSSNYYYSIIQLEVFGGTPVK